MKEAEFLRKVARYCELAEAIGSDLAEYLEDGGDLAWKHVLEAIPDGQILPVVMTVSPELASEMRGREKDNRNRRPERVSAYGADMAEGRWRLTGESPKIGRDGILKDGGHRVAAAEEAEAPFRSLVVFGVEDEAVLSMDSGLTRSPGDALKYAGFEYRNRNSVAAAAKRLWLWDRGTVFSRSGGAARQTREEMAEYLRDHPEIAEIAALVSDSRTPPGFNASLAATVMVLFHRKDPDRAETFLAQWRDGENLSREDPAYQLRERLSKARRTGTYDKRLATFSPEEKLWLALRAFKAFCKGEKMSKLQLPSTLRTASFWQFGLPVTEDAREALAEV